MRLAVTGGAGFIGSHVVDKLVGAGHQVVVVDVRPPHRPDVAHRQVDLADFSGLVRATAGCDAVFHLAGVANVNDAFADPVGTFETNVSGTARVWEAARRNQIGRAILASTVWVYGAAPDGPADAPLTEDTPLQSQRAGHVYTASKMAAELVATSYGDLYGLPWTILRYGIPYGPRMREELVIPRFISQARDGKQLTVHGDGLQYRNYVYVEDLADAHVAALAEAGTNEVFNLEGPGPVSIRRLAETVQRLIDPSLPIVYVAGRPGDYEGRPVSGAKAARLLGWEPATDFDAGMARHLDWLLGTAEGEGRVAGRL